VTGECLGECILSPPDLEEKPRRNAVQGRVGVALQKKPNNLFRLGAREKEFFSHAEPQQGACSGAGTGSFGQKSGERGL